MDKSIVSDIAAATAKKLGPLDLREFQKTLYKSQRQQRLDAPIRRELAAYDRRKHRIRIRLPRAFEGNAVVDTRTDKAKNRLYFELANGQSVRADRILGTRGKSFSNNNSAWRRFKNHTSNQLLVNIVLRETEKNAARENSVENALKAA